MSAADAVLGTAAYDETDGLATLGPEAAAVLDAVDRLALTWAREAGAGEVLLSPLFRVSDLESVDYFVNFPHLGLATTGLRAELAVTKERTDRAELGSDLLEPAATMLPSAACYGLYFAVRGRQLPEPVVRTVRQRCFRRETHYQGLQRLNGFSMREIVYLGTADGAREHLEHFRPKVVALLDALGIPTEVATAQDPFYDSRSSRALLQRLDPVKHEFVAYGETAIASLNVHRNFFGERCDIRLPDGSGPISTSCVAFGLERWVWALRRRFGGDLVAAAEAVAALAAPAPVA